MSFRFKLSIILIVLGAILVFLPTNRFSSKELKPTELLNKSLNENEYFSVDQVARFLVTEDTSILIIDVRSPEEYVLFNIPGSINIPYSDLLNKDWQGYLNQKEIKNIFYSNGDILSTNAWLITSRLGYENNFIMKGGLNEWYATVMERKFEGRKISAKENALFEYRFKAKRLFTQLNSLPDSMKTKFIAAKRLKETKLDGGCN